VRICAEHLPIQAPIYEFGALQVSGAEDEDLRSLFPGCEYIGADMREGPGVDQVLDLHHIDLADEVAESVLCLDTLEHVEHPRKAISEIYRLLRSDGILVLSSVFEFPIHGYPNDYWRFTPEGFRSLLKPFANSYVCCFGRSEDRPQCIAAVAFKGRAPELRDFQLSCEKWSKWNSAIIREMLRSNSIPQ
jgi:SAM-dependent methyltransferase